jgi:hypothetical protein
MDDQPVVRIDETPGRIAVGTAYYPRHLAPDDRPRLVRVDPDGYQPRHAAEEK